MALLWNRFGIWMCVEWTHEARDEPQRPVNVTIGI